MIHKDGSKIGLLRKDSAAALFLLKTRDTGKIRSGVMINVLHKGDHAGKLVFTHMVHFGYGHRNVKRKGFAHVKKFLRCDVKIIADIKKGTHAWKCFFVFDFVNVAFA